jgi:hypothetical protein
MLSLNLDLNVPALSGRYPKLDLSPVTVRSSGFAVSDDGVAYTQRHSSGVVADRSDADVRSVPEQHGDLLAAVAHIVDQADNDGRKMLRYTPANRPRAFGIPTPHAGDARFPCWRRGLGRT